MFAWRLQTKIQHLHKGFKKYSHIYERLEDHEGSKSQNDAVLSFINAEAGKSIDREMVGVRKQQVLGNVDVLKRILADIYNTWGNQLYLSAVRGMNQVLIYTIIR